MPGASETEPVQKIVYKGTTTEEQIDNAIISDRLQQILYMLAYYMGGIDKVPPNMVNTIRVCQQERFEIVQGDDGKDAPPQ